MAQLLELITTWEFWLILAAVCVILELITNTFAMFAMAGGCVLAVFAQLFICDGLAAQLIAFSFGTVFSFVCLKPIAKKHLESKESAQYKSNIDALVGREAIACQDSDENGITRVKIDGDSWQARTKDLATVLKGNRIKVVGYESIVLIIEII